MPDAASTITAFAPGDRVLVRDAPLLGPRVVVSVRTVFAGEPEPNGPVSCYREEEVGLWAPPRLVYDQCELVPCPSEYEAVPSSDEPVLVLCWLYRNLAMLLALHGAETVARTERHIRERMRLRERIGAALAAEPDATAVRRAEIAVEAGR